MSNNHITHSHHIKHVPGGINPIKRQSYNTVLNINTKFRDNYSFTESNDFLINLPQTIKDVVHMKVLDFAIPSTISITSFNNNNNFYLKLYNPENDTYAEDRIYIPNGSYEGNDLAEAINKELLNKNFNNIKFIYSKNSNSFSIPCGLISFTGSFLNFSLVPGEQIELFIISLNPIPIRLLLIIDSILLILFFPISGIDIDIFEFTGILLNP